MERKKQLIRETIESISSLMNNVSEYSKDLGFFVKETTDLLSAVNDCLYKIAFDIHNSGQYLPDGHPYFVNNPLKHFKGHLYICLNYLWVFDSVGKNWVKGSRVFARKCYITGEGMNEGFCIQNGLMYIKNSDDLDMHIKNDTDYKSTSDALNEDYYYYTEWECPLDYQYKLENSKLVDL